MSILTATQVTQYSNISASTATITSSGLIPIIQERICLITNNYFTSDVLSVECIATFNTTARSIFIDQTSWEQFGFKANDDIMIYGSYRNDGVVTIESLSAATAILTSSCSVVDESFSTNTGAITFFAVVRWPVSIQQIAAQMIAYDYDIRDKVSANIKSHSLGPFSESFSSGDEDEFGYPRKITNQLDKFKIARLM